MKSKLRAAATAAAVLAASYGLVTGANQTAAAHTTAAAPRSAAVTLGQRAVTETGFATTLPSPIYDILVDDTHRQVFISSFDTLTVTDLDGQVTKTITGLGPIGEIALAADNSVVYAPMTRAEAIAAIDTTTHKVTQLALPPQTCALSPAYSGGKLWFSEYSCGADDITFGISSLNPATGEVARAVETTYRVHVHALPDRPDRLVAVATGGDLWVYDVSGDTPEVLASRPTDGSHRFCYDAALIGAGDQVAVACATQPVHRAFNTVDLSENNPIATRLHPNAVAASPDGRLLAAGVRSPDGCDIFVRNIENGTPGGFVSSYDFGSSALTHRALAYSATGRLYAVTPQTEGGSLLHVLTEPAKCPTRFRPLQSPNAVAPHNTVTVSGNLGHEPGASTHVSVTRTDRNGTHDLGSVEVASDGAFTFSDRPRVSGSVTYRVEYAGDESYGPGWARSSTRVNPAYDIGGDGLASAVVGAPGEDLGTRRDAGMVHVLSGPPNGLTGTGSVAIHQDTPGVPGTPEAGDRFGYSDASGDFNGDGYADVAVSAPYENVGSARDGGCVWIFHGSASGLRVDTATTISIHNALSGADAEGAHFGRALAAGDFTGDGRDDLAIGAPGASRVFIARGTSGGLHRDSLQHISESSFGVPGEFRRADRFGHSLAVGDIDGDGRDDLAIGANYDSEDRGWSTGSVTLLYGSGPGLTGDRAQRWSKETAGVPGAAGTDSDSEWSDQFGRQVALADFNGDGKADLAVGAPGAPVTVDGVRKRDAGTVTVLYSDGAKISTDGAEEVTQQTLGMPGVSGHIDRLGSTLAAGDANGDGVAELAVHSPGDTYVTVVSGASGGLAYGDARGWTQNSSGIPGSSETGDNWGDSLRFADIRGTGYHSLIVGAPGENSGAGAITVIYSANTGLTDAGAKYFSQNSTGIPGTAERGDAFGTFR